MAQSPRMMEPSTEQFSLTLDDSPRRTIDGESPRRARTIMVRRPLREDAPERPTQSASGRARNVIVAHGVHPGQTIELAHGEKATLSEVEADRRQPQSVALSRVEQRIPRARCFLTPHLF